MNKKHNHQNKRLRSEQEVRSHNSNEHPMELRAVTAMQVTFEDGTVMKKLHSTHICDTCGFTVVIRDVISKEKSYL